MGRLILLRDRQGRIGVGESKIRFRYVSPDLRTAQIGGHIPEPDLRADFFAYEMAELDLVGQQRGVPAWRLLGGVDGSPRACSQLVFEAREIAPALARGFRTIKIKDLALGELERSYALRVDLNGRPLFDRTLIFRPELVEEPGELDSLEIPPAAPPIALDESLARPDGVARGLELIERGLVSAMVLKPMLLGGARRCLEIAQRAKRLGPELIVTHMLDGPVAHAAAAQLAFALPKGRFAHGLGLHPGVDARLVPHLRGAWLIAPEWPGVVAPHVREAVLRGIA